MADHMGLVSKNITNSTNLVIHAMLVVLRDAGDDKFANVYETRMGRPHGK